MKDAILILTNSQDGKHTDVVISKLKKLGQCVFRFDADKFASGELQVNFYANQGNTGFEMIYGNKALSSKDIKSVWYRRPNFLDVQIKDPIQKKYAEDEIRIFLEGLWSILDDVFWLSNPNSLERARKKILQLRLAQEIGFTVPETIVTNNPQEARNFFARCGGKIIFKAINHESLDYVGRNFTISTTLITESHLAKIDLVRYMPSLFQELIEKEYELRVTMVGDKIFPIKIDSQKNPLTIIDWRNPELIDKLSYAPVDISNSMAERCLSMQEKLNLSFGCFDFAKDKKGNFYFFEVNPSGQWYWLESLTGVLISDAIVDILIKAPKKGGDAYGA